MNKMYNSFGLSRVTLRNIDKNCCEILKKSAFTKNFQASLKALIMLIMMTIGLNSIAQSTANYAFSTNTTGSMVLTSSGAAVDMTTGTTQLVAAGVDDLTSSVFNIGFPFYFMGSLYTQFSATSNGKLGFGAVAPSNVGNTTGTTTLPVLNPFGGDMQISSTGKVHFKLIGSIPNRVLIVEWLNMELDYQSSTINGTFQVLLYENSGIVEFKYANMTVADLFNTGPFVGMSAGIAANQTVSIATATNTATNGTSYTANTYPLGPIVNLNSTTDGSRRVYTFTPPTAALNPITLTYTAVTQAATTPNWVDNSTTESWFNVTRATNASLTQNVVTTRVNSTTIAGTGTVYTLPQTGLLPGVTYFYSIQAGNEGFAPSTGLTGSQITLPPTANTSVASGLWSATSTWSTGTVPTSFENVTIATGHTVTIDVSANANALTINGDLIYEATTLRTLTVSSNVTVNTGASFKSAATGAVVTHVLNIGGSLVNNGTIDFSNFANATGATIVFNSASNANFTLGATSITNLRNTAGVTVSKGTNISSVLTFNPGGTLTVQGANALGFLVLSNGLFVVSGTNTFSNPLFSVAGYTIAATAGLSLENANATIIGLNGSPTNNGLFRINSGTYNIGTGAGNSFGFSINSTAIITGGTINSVARFGVGSAGNAITYTQSGGTINVNSIENLSTTLASFDLGTSTTSTISMTGGTVNVILPSTAAFGPRDVRGTNATATAILSGGTINFGTAASGASKTYFISGAVPNIVINNASAVHNLSCSTLTQIFSNVNIPLGSILNLNGFRFINRGATLTNNGIITGTTAGSDLYFLSETFNQNYVGTGTVTSGLATLTIQKGATSLTIDPAAGSFSVLRANLFSGNIINSNKLTIGTGAALSCAVQIGVGANTFAGGNFDVAPNWNLGTGLYSLIYSIETASRTTGFEVPPSRMVATLSNANPNGLTISGGAIDVSTTLTLTDGIINTSATNLIRLASTGTLAGTPSVTNMIVGPFTRSFAASRTATGTFDNTTLFPVGKIGAYLPITIDPTTTAGGTVTFNSESFTTNTGTAGVGVSAFSTNRFQSLVSNGAANLTSAFVRLSDVAISPMNRIVGATTATGTYNPVASPITAVSGTLTLVTPILAASYTGFFAYGNVANCPAPTNQATALVFANKATTSVNLSFTAVTSMPTGYLVVRYPAGASPVSSPMDLVTYAPAAALGASGTIVSSGPSLSVISTGLTANTAYDYRVFSFNNAGCGGPVYNILTPLTASITTCVTNIGASGNPTASTPTTNSVTASWTASATPGVTYVIDVATNNIFTNFVAGYNGLNLGAASTTNITGLTSATNYFVRVRATDGNCTSSNSATLNIATICNASNIPYSENFESVTIPALPVCTLNINAGAGNNWNTSSPNANGFTSRTLQYSWNSSNAANAWFMTNGLNLVAGTTYAISFKYGNNNGTYTEKLKVHVGTVATVAGMSVTPLVDYPTINQATVQNGVASFTPIANGVYFFGFNSYATANQFILYVDDILVDVGCTGTPNPGNTITSNAIACLGSSVSLSLQNATAGSAVTYAWQSSPDGVAPYTPIALATASTLTITSIATSAFYRCIVTCGPNAVTSTAVQVTVPTPTVAPVAVNQAVCTGSTVAALAATGTGIKWYATPTGGLALNPVGVVVPGTYYATQTIAGCESVSRASSTITIDACSIPYANIQFPGVSTIFGCQNQTFYARSYKAGVTEAPGAGVGMKTWFAVSTTNTDPATWSPALWQLGTFNVQSGNDDEFQFTTSGLGSGVYYVASRVQYSISPTSSGQFVYGGFSSGGGGLWNGTNNVNAELTVIAVAPPTAAANQAICNSGTVANLTATGTLVKWYTTPTLGSALAATTTLMTGNYYASQTLSGCESTVRTLVAVTVNMPAAPTATATQAICNSGTVANLTATGSGIKWYAAATGGTALASTSTLTATNYFASQTIAGCESVSRTQVAVTISTPLAPTAAATQAICNSGTVANLTATGSGIKWYAAATGGTALASTSTLTATNYFASQTIAGCESVSRTQVAVTIGVTLAPTGSATQSFTTATFVILANLTVTGTNIVWFSSSANALANTSPLAASTTLVTGTTYFAMQTIGTCRSASPLAVLVTITLGLNDVAFSGLEFYPNPVSSKLTLSNSNPIVAIEVFNMLGQKVAIASPNTLTTQLDMSNLQAGTYLVQVVSEGKMKVVKVVKN